jgi:hypothetical protein
VWSQHCKEWLLALSCLFVWPSTWNISAYTVWILIKFDIKVFWKSVKKIQVSLNYDKNNGCFMWRPFHICDKSCWILLRMKNVKMKVVGKIRTHVLCLITFFQKLCHLWDNVKKYGGARETTDDNIIWCMCFACWISKARDAHAHACTQTQICNIYRFSTATVVLWTHPIVML